MDGFEEQLRKSLGSQVRLNEPLSRHTSFHIGGPARFLCLAEDVEDLTRAVGLARDSGIPYIILGKGTNILVSDEGFSGLVILNLWSGWEMSAEDEHLKIKASSGTTLSRLVRWSIHEGWQGLEWAAGIPGTVGGAVVSNAGAFGASIADVLEKVTVLNRRGQVEEVPASALELGYRHSAFRPGGARRCEVILEAELRLRRGQKDELLEAAMGSLAERRRRQPHQPSAGSVFKNPPGDYAARLIEEAGLKGFRLGDAQFSPVHTNFIVNLGKAKAKDVLELIRIAQERVYRRFGVKLELEIELVGFKPEQLTRVSWMDSQ